MQTNTRVHDTDQKEENAMNNNPKYGNSHKEERMNAITKTTKEYCDVLAGQLTSDRLNYLWVAPTPRPRAHRQDRLRCRTVVPPCLPAGAKQPRRPQTTAKESVIMRVELCLKIVLAALCVALFWAGSLAWAADAQPDPAAPQPVELDLAAEWETQFDHLLWQMTAQKRAWFAHVERETHRRDALILPEDRDPVDVVLRRTARLLADIVGRGKPRYDLSDVEPQLRALKAESDRTPPQMREEVVRAAVDGHKHADVANRAERLAIFQKVCQLRRRIAFANPLLDFDDILFSIGGGTIDVRRMYHGYRLSSVGPGWRNAPDGIFVLHDAFGPRPAVRNVLAGRTVADGRLKGQQLSTGSARWPELSYDGKTVAFAYTEGIRDPALNPDVGQCETASFHLFKAALEGNEPIVQLTDGVNDDADPCWLPNGRIAFFSTRRGGSHRCGAGHKTPTLFSMNDDGSNLICLSFHETAEFSPAVLDNGMICYCRWDYIDRGSNETFHPWVCYPDGRDARAIHGNYPVTRWYEKGGSTRRRPVTMFGVRSIPGSGKLAGTANPLHRDLTPTVVLLDPNVEDDGEVSQLTRVTPENCYLGTREQEVFGGNIVPYGGYDHPWPLSVDYFLCSHRGGLFLIDSFGNRELLCRTKMQGKSAGPPCRDPMPARPRIRPPILPCGTANERPKGATATSARSTPPVTVPDDALAKWLRVRPAPPVVGAGDDAQPATVACINVYDSLKPWPDGTRIAALRVVQLFPKQHGTWDLYPATGHRTDALVRGVLGTVPVEEDGSVHFTCPPNKLIYFQALDKQGRAVQSMMSGTYLHPGEQMVCQGCHERRVQTAPISAGSGPPRALRRAPSALKPEVDGAYPILFPKLVQPVLDKHCVACHKEKNPKRDLSGTVVEVCKERDPVLAGGLSKTGPGTYFTQSYLSFRGLTWSSRDIRSTPGQVGALAAPLYAKILKDGHKGRVNLSPEEMHRIVLWLDCNSNFLGAYHDTEKQARGESVFPLIE